MQKPNQEEKIYALWYDIWNSQDGHIAYLNIESDVDQFDLLKKKFFNSEGKEFLDDTVDYFNRFLGFLKDQQISFRLINRDDTSDICLDDFINEEGENQ